MKRKDFFFKKIISDFLFQGIATGIRNSWKNANSEWWKMSLLMTHKDFLMFYILTITVCKVSKYGVTSGQYFPVFWLNTEIYRLNLRIQSEYRKIPSRNNSGFGYYSGSAVIPIMMHFNHDGKSWKCLTLFWLGKNYQNLKRYCLKCHLYRKWCLFIEATPIKPLYSVVRFFVRSTVTQTVQVSQASKNLNLNAKICRSQM